MPEPTPRDGFMLVRNNTAVSQQFGVHVIPPRSFGELPNAVAESLIRHPMKELTVFQPEVGPQVFLRTPHLPTSRRYQERARGTERR